MFRPSRRGIHAIVITSFALGSTLSVFISSESIAAVTPVESFAGAKPAITDRLGQIRLKVLDLEQVLIDGLKKQAEAKANLRRIRELMDLQREERSLGKQRMKELETTIAELQSRRGILNEKIDGRRLSVRRLLRELQRAAAEPPRSLQRSERDRIEGPRRRLLAALVGMGVKEIETFRIDLADGDRLEAKIQEEQGHFAYLFQDLREQEGILELNRQLQADLLKRTHAERLARLEAYRSLKASEGQVERLIGNLNARRELEKTVATERVASVAMMQGVFGKLKGHLPFPVQGKILTQFGPSFDEHAGLNVFKKGIDIAVGANVPVRAISAGKIAYSGELANYGQVTIIDHGDHFYSLYAHLGALNKKVSDPVAAGDEIGSSSDSGLPVYFEIRARNIAVNPMQWLNAPVEVASQT